MGQPTQVIAALQSGGVAIVPTATGYALAGNPFSPAAVGEIFRLKARPSELPLLLLCRDVKQARQLIEPPDDCRFSALAYRFWPGPLTVVAKAVEPRLATGVIAADGTVALRVDADAQLAELLAALDFPLVGTSANRHGTPTPAVVREALWQLGDLPAVDGGARPASRPSTLIRLEPEGFTLLREGAVPRAELDEFFAKPCAPEQP